MDAIITFDKSFQRRLSEFNEVLSGSDILSASQLQRQWGFFIELTVDKIGWQAIWKIPRITCDSLKIPFPSIALVIVLDVSTKELKAFVRILALEDDFGIPEKVWVPLTQLWPTEQQDKSVFLNLMETANSLDMLRFFYLYVYMPWDRDEDDNQDWLEKHLESRLRFYYDIKNGNIPRSVAEHIHNLLTEARRLQQRRDFLEEQVRKEEEQGVEYGLSQDEVTKTLTKIHVRLLELRTDIEIAENPLLRNIIIERFTKMGKISSDPQVWLIFQEGTAEEHIKFLTQVESIYPNDNLKFCTNFATKLATAGRNDTYLLNQSIHRVETAGSLEEGGKVIGIGSRDKVQLVSDVEDVMFNLLGDLVVIENLTIDAKSAQCGILVRKGNCVIKNCKLTGKGSSLIYQGIIVLNGANLQLENCEITGFSTAIVGNSESNITIKNCDIHHVDVGLKIFDKSVVSMENVLIRECMQFGLICETENIKVDIGNFECLEKIPEMTFSGVTGNNNTRGDVAILERSKLKPVEDLFADPDKDPTIIGSDDENMF